MTQIGANVRDSACAAEQAAIETKNAIEAGARIIIGLPCVEALDAAAAQIASLKSDTIILALGVQLAGTISSVYKIAPPAEQEAETIANYIGQNWRNVNFAIIEDGTLYGRQLAETVRFLLAENNLTPVFTDTYRPLLDRQSGLVRRIAKAGATHVFIGGDAYDVSIIAQDAAALGIDLKFAGGSALRAPKDEGTLPDGAIFTAVDVMSFEVANQKYEGYAALTFVAKTIADQALSRAKGNRTTVSDAISDFDFETPIGPIRFNQARENDRAWFDIFNVQDGKFIKLDRKN
ncbi:MAG: ABC transporter substrate-binding protein [Ahrensia sp.]|nr:ABC transporter substrate-binding protein [Ahrensia sp.]